MAKLKLDLQSLEVTTFETSALEEARGTVEARATFNCTGEYYTCGDTTCIDSGGACTFDPTCSFTCDCPTIGCGLPTRQVTCRCL